MVTGSIDIQAVAMLTDTFRHAQIRGIDTVFLAAFEIKINVHFQIFVLLRGRFHLDETMMRRRHNFLADFTMDVRAAGMSFE
jgi:hypothetical protein